MTEPLDSSCWTVSDRPASQLAREIFADWTGQGIPLHVYVACAAGLLLATVLGWMFL